MEKQVLNSPFLKKEYLNLVKQFNDEQDKIFDDFAISDKTIVNIYGQLIKQCEYFFGLRFDNFLYKHLRYLLTIKIYSSIQMLSY